MIQSINKIIKYWKSILVLLLILHLSFAPPSEFKKIPTLFDNEDKLIHVLMYMGLTTVLMFDVSRNMKDWAAKRNRILLICIAFPVVAGGVIEILQPIISFPRTASWFDWLADIWGVLLGWYMMKILFRLLKSHHQ